MELVHDLVYGSIYSPYVVGTKYCCQRGNYILMNISNKILSSSYLCKYVLLRANSWPQMIPII